jgi:Ca-activated chloride channel family protein
VHQLADRPRPFSKRQGVRVGVAVGLFALTACTGGASTETKPKATPTYAPYPLYVLASDELADLDRLGILKAAAQATGVTVKLTYTGTLTGTQAVLDGRASGYQAVWFSSNNYFMLHLGGLAKLDASNRIMYSPVILGLQTSVAQRLGWIGKPVSWADIAAAAAAHKFTFGMTDPNLSNSGFLALASAATALAGKGAALQESEIPAAIHALHGLFGQQHLKRPSSGKLADAYRDNGTPPVDGLIEYESVLLSLNASGKLREPLTLIYPSDGVITDTYPFSLLASAPAAAKNAYTRLVNYLLRTDVQQRIMNLTGRRPATLGVQLDAALRSHPLLEQPFPGTIGVVNDLLAAYNGTLRLPARTVYVLDTSGSMAGSRIAELKQALDYLTGATASPAGRSSQFQEREQVTLLPFSTTPGTADTVNIPARNPEQALAQIRSDAGNLTAFGWTAIYTALESAYRVITAEAATDPNRITTIVLLTDGENNRGDDLRAFTAFYDRLLPAIAAVPVFPVLFGEARRADMNAIAQLTGGAVYDARAQSLTAVFGAIRGNQ